MKTSETTLVIFGITGDLSRKKILPSLFSRFLKGNSSITIIGFSRRAFTNEEFRMFVTEELIAQGKGSSQEINDFVQEISYVQGEIHDSERYRCLKNHLSEKIPAMPNLLFFLSISPEFYETVFYNLSEARLTEPTNEQRINVLVEKPFGHNLESYDHLVMCAESTVGMKNILVIDHYLGKDFLEELLGLKKEINLQALAAKNFIEKVEISLREQIGVEERGTFYDSTGALRDVGQNHLLEVLVFLIGNFNVFPSSRERFEVLHTLQKYSPKEAGASITYGQYEGYRNVQGVQPDSNTETYFKLKIFKEKGDWRDIPLILEAGKKLPEGNLMINLTLRYNDDPQIPEIIHIMLQPTFFAKLKYRDGSVKTIDSSFEGKTEAYERVIQKALEGNKDYFAGQEEIRSLWEIITPFLQNQKLPPPLIYKQGTLPNS